MKIKKILKIIPLFTHYTGNFLEVCYNSGNKQQTLQLMSHQFSVQTLLL